MDELQKEQFEEKAKDMMKWLCENGHPHMSIVITPTTAELAEGVIGITSSEFVVD